MQYENRIRKKCVLQRGKKIRFGFQKAFFQNVHLGKKRGGGPCLIIRVVLYSGQYGTF